MTNNLIKELKLKIIPLFIYYIFYQLILELSYLFRKSIIKISGVKRLKKLSEDGYIKIENYYDSSFIDYIVKQTLNNPILENNLSKSILGTKKYNSLEKIHLFKIFINDVYLIWVNFLLTFRLNRPTVKLLHTIHVENQKIMADHAHFDAYRHEIKVLIPLQDINIDNGPTEFIPFSGEFQYKYFKQYFVSWLTVKGYLKENHMNMINPIIFKENVKISFTANKGDIIIFNSRFLHRATKPIHGERVVLWLYF